MRLFEQFLERYDSLATEDHCRSDCSSRGEDGSDYRDAMLIGEGWQQNGSPLFKLCDDAVTATIGDITSRHETGLVKVTYLCWSDVVEQVIQKFNLCEKPTHPKRIKRDATHVIYRSQNLI